MTGIWKDATRFKKAAEAIRNVAGAGLSAEDELRAYVPHDKENGTAILVAKIESIAALASQPAPEETK